MSHWELNLEKLLARQARLRQLQERLQEEPEPQAPFLTVSRDFGCPGIRLGLQLVEELNAGRPEEEHWSVYDRRVFEAMEESPGLDASLFEATVGHHGDDLKGYLYTTFGVRPEELFVFRRWTSAIRRLAKRGYCVLVGRGAHLVTRELPMGLHLRIVAPFEWRVEQVRELHGLESELAHALVRRRDRERRQYLEQYFDRPGDLAQDSDLILNCARLAPAEVQEQILHLLQRRGWLKRQP